MIAKCYSAGIQIGLLKLLHIANTCRLRRSWVVEEVTVKVQSRSWINAHLYATLGE